MGGMRGLLSIALAAALGLPGVSAVAQASAAVASGKAQPSPLAPSEIVAAAPAGDWVRIAPADLLVMMLAPDAKGRERRVVIQLIPPPFSQGWVGNVRKLAAAHWWDGLSVNRVQDNYVVQWGDADADDKARARALPGGLAVVPESEYVSPAHIWKSLGYLVAEGGWTKPGPPPPPPLDKIQDVYAGDIGFGRGWPLARGGESFWPVHCYGMVGVGRDLPPNTGTGAELYTVIGHAPRHLDRNIALVGRVIEGIEHLSSLPRGTKALGFYATAEERTPIVSIRLGNEVPGLPAYEYLSTESASFARYADARANRRDSFFIWPAGGADICNIPVPVRRVP